MKQFVLTCGLILLLVAISQAAFPAEGGSPAAETIKLKTTPLRQTAWILSKGDLKSSNAYQPVTIYDGTVVSLAYKHDFASKRTVDFTIGDSTFSVVYDGSRFFFRAGSRSKAMRKSGPGLAPQMLSLPDKRKYILAFPRAFETSDSPYLYWRCGCIEKGKLGRNDICLYDDDLNGFYTMEDDTFQIGTATVFAPISPLVATQDAVYKIEQISRNGSEILHTEHSGDTGKICVKCAASGLQGHLAFGAKDAGLNFVATTGKGSDLTVVPGSYELLYGLVYDSKKKLVAGVMPGKLEPVKVSSSETAEVTLGGPFRITFTPEKENNKLTINPSTIKLFGAAGEEYVSFKHATPPRIYVNGKQVGKMEFG